MQFSAILSVATALAAMTPTVLGADFTFKKAAYTDCSWNKLGPEHAGYRGSCIGLFDTDHGIKVTSIASGCKIRGFQSGNCEGSSVIAFSSLQCHALRKPDYSYDIWSLRLDC
ncbi:hypothetical protein CNMCM5793_005928 [Aspergillus hiratsukae]|uniref:Uncharacterized protein n=1 Tax=Aspergillus hiratsukae TaxID=1194566 RepID=A0A8H6QIM5_9EURO|nr:hypothetical protein CNMCM5793_005928 [Aspergillus hiratsukae]KAF7172581.1 hypothetical protein CNMCM6106_006757 [Aspergillus hiratsukae]